MTKANRAQSLVDTACRSKKGIHFPGIPRVLPDSMLEECKHKGRLRARCMLMGMIAGQYVCSSAKVEIDKTFICPLKRKEGSGEIHL
jgi:hypothetical protein